MLHYLFIKKFVIFFNIKMEINQKLSQLNIICKKICSNSPKQMVRKCVHSGHSRNTEILLNF